MNENTTRPIDQKPYGGTLENWRLEHAGTAWIVLGNLYGDPAGRWQDGYPIHTSGVVSINGGNLITRNTRYTLGAWHNPA